jgi:hypothetical protein
MSSLVQIQLRRDTLANWTASNPLLKQGEPALEVDTGRLKFGDGSNTYNSLPYFENDKTFVFDQVTPATLWNVTHNLGKFPSVTVVDSANTVIQAQVNQISVNSLDIILNNATSGKAYIN